MIEETREKKTDGVGASGRVNRLAEKFETLRKEWPDMYDLLWREVERSIATLRGIPDKEPVGGGRDFRTLLDLDLNEAMRLAAEIHWAAEKARKRAANKVGKAKRLARPPGHRPARRSRK